MPLTLPALLYSAKDRVSTLTATVRISYAVRRGMSAWQPERARLEADRFTTAASRSFPDEALDPSDVDITELRLWLRQPDGFRSESERRIAGKWYETITVVSPEAWWVYRQGVGVETSALLPAPRPSFDHRSLGPERYLIDPAPTVSLVEFGELVHENQQGRSIIRVQATPRLLLGSPIGSIWDGVEQYQFDIDAANGFPWRLAAFAQGERFAALDVNGAAFDAPLPDALFSFSPSPDMDVFPPGRGRPAQTGAGADVWHRAEAVAMSRRGLAIAYGGLILLSMLGIVAGFGESDAATTIGGATPGLADGWIRLEPLPDRPPVVHLRRADTPFAAVDADPVGVLVTSDWVAGGRTRSYDMSPPIAWSDALAYPDGRLAVDLGDRGAPALAELRFYRRVDDQGRPMGEPSIVRCEFGEANDATPGPGAEACVTERDAKTNAWIVNATLPPDPGRYFVAVWTAWMIPLDAAGAADATPMSAYAAWIFTIDRP